MGKILKRIIIFSVVLIVVFNTSFPLMSHANDIATAEELFSGTFQDVWTNIGGKVIDGIAGILSWIWRAPIAAAGLVVQTVVSQLCGIFDDNIVVTAEDIIFTGSSRNQQVNIINANFFDLSSQTMNDSIVKSFREGVAKWYYALRNLSIVISLAVFLYIGIRMVISSVASDKAMYKKMLVDWLVGFIVLFFLHYFMIIIFNLNDQLVEMLYNIHTRNTAANLFSDYTFELLKGSFSVLSFVTGVGSLLVYVILLGTTISLFIMYMKRLLTLGFLVVISPLITITYSIDKIGDNKSQALDTWMKEFIYNVLIQPFHCIIYMVFVSSAMNVLQSDKSLTSIIFACASILFIFKAEDIIKKIFGFEKASSMAGIAAAGALAGTALGKISSGVSAVSGNKKGNNTSKIESSNTSSKGVKRKQVPATGSNNTNKTTNTGSNMSNQNSIPKKKSALSRAASDMWSSTKNNFNEFKAHPGSSIGNGMKQLALKELALATKMAPKVLTGGIITGATGNAVTGFATGYSTTGGRFTRKVSSMAYGKANELKMDEEARKLATAYGAYQMKNSDLKDEELYNKSADLLEADISKLTDKNEINLAKQLQNMEKKYEALGEEKPKDAVMKKIENIQMGNIKSRADISLDKVVNAAQSLKQSSSGLTDDKIKEISKDFMSDMDEVKRLGENYLKSEKYTGLGKDQKALAREIYKSKEVLSAIGENSNSTINTEIEKSIENGLKK